jgi:glycosyltransferase involved in cell wall biosynthesis
MEVATRALVDELRRAGIEFVRVNTADPDDALTNRARWTVRNVRMALRHVGSAFRQAFARDVAAVYVPISQELPAFYRDALFVLAGQLARKPVVIHVHGGAFHRFYADASSVIRALVRSTAGRAALGIVLSERLRPTLECILPPSRVHPVELGVDVDFSALPGRRSDDGGATVLFLSTLHPHKGVLVFLEAVALARRRHPELRAVVAGNWFWEETRAEAEALTRALELEQAVSFPGTVIGTAKADLFARSDVFSLPSFYELEGTPLVIVEAMAAGVPVIATAWAGIPDLVEDGRTGLLIDEPSPSLLAEKLLFLLDRPDVREAMGAAGRERYRTRFTQEAFGRRMIAALEPFLSEAARDDARGPVTVAARSSELPR